MNISKVVGFTVVEYFLNIAHSFFNIIVMSIFISVYQNTFDHFMQDGSIPESLVFRLAGTIIVGVISYLAASFVSDRRILSSLSLSLSRKEVEP